MVDWIQPVEDEPRWSAEARRPALENVHEITARFEEGSSAGPGVDAALLCAYDTLAAQRVERGCRILARGRVVVADRLHGHILSLLMGLPNVVLDNSYGKTRAVYETWTARCELATWADSPDEALQRPGESAYRQPLSQSLSLSWSLRRPVVDGVAGQLERARRVADGPERSSASTPAFAMLGPRTATSARRAASRRRSSPSSTSSSLPTGRTTRPSRSRCRPRCPQ